MFNTVSFDFAFAQNQDSLINNEQEIIQSLNELDGLLTTTIPATLTGLSLAGASFLVRTTTDDKYAIIIEHARKNFVGAFLFFLSCLISIFAFDMIEILVRPSVPIMIFDTVTTYGLFGIGSFFLVKAARGIYFSFVNK